MEWIETSQSSLLWRYVIYLWFLSFILLLRLAFYTYIMFPFTQHIYIMKHSSPTIHCRVLSLPAFPQRRYHSPISYCICCALSSNLTCTIFVFICVFLHAISHFLLRSIFPSNCILSPHFSLNTLVPAVTDGRTSGTKNIEIKKQLCVNSAMNRFSIAERSSSPAKTLLI